MLTSKPRKLPLEAHVTDGVGSNHSGETPSRFSSVLTEATVTDPVPRTKIRALPQNTRPQSIVETHSTNSYQ